MRIVKSEVRNVDLSHLNHLVLQDEGTEERHRITAPAGEESCRLLAYLSSKMDGIKIAELGVRHGTTAICLANNLKNEVHAYDVHEPYLEDNRRRIQLPNLTFINEDLLEPKNIHKTLNYSLIHLDVDPHDGDKERIWYDYWVANDYKGLVVADDVSEHWPGLLRWWETIKTPKYDLRDIGHKTGCGLLAFGIEVEITDD